MSVYENKFFKKSTYTGTFEEKTRDKEQELRTSRETEGVCQRREKLVTVTAEEQAV